jgi:outer membrane protein OmpA-like peptidoglycan-associated protein
MILPNTTSLALSRSVFNELKQTGKAKLGLMIDTSQKKIFGSISVIETVRYPIVINHKTTNVRALHAKGRFKAGKIQADGDFYIVNDASNPLLLRYHIQMFSQNFRRGKANRPLTMNVVRINTGLSQRAALEQTLKTIRRFELYGIHFNFASASLRPQVRSLIGDIAAALKNNPSWRLSIQGHTDSIGGAAANQRLSERRAAAIKTALVRRHNIAANRLVVVGFGLTRPKDTNDTLGGRALNRRVELVRTN